MTYPLIALTTTIDWLFAPGCPHSPDAGQAEQAAQKSKDQAFRIPEQGCHSANQTSKWLLEVSILHPHIIHQSKFDRFHIVFNQEEVKHFITPSPDVMYCWVKREGEGNVTDLISFYNLPSHVLKKKGMQLRAAYSFYTIATSVDPLQLWKDTLVMANNNGFDVFNCLDNLDNGKVFDDLVFRRGSGNLNFYLYNWRLSK